MTNPGAALAWMAVFFISFAVYIYLSNAFTGQNLHVWTDEIIYSMESRHLDLSTATYPVFLYLSTFSLAHTSGSGFLESARHMNALQIALALPFLYMTARHYVSPGWSCALVLIVAFSPITTYAAYFMPDTMFFSTFFVYAWFCLTRHSLGALRYGAGVGILAALLTLVKPHGLFLFAAFLVAQSLYALINRSPGVLKEWLRISLVSTLFFVLIRSGAGYILSGSIGLFGAYSVLSPTSWDHSKFIAALSLGLILAKGHAVAITAILGPCLLAIFLPVSENQNYKKILFLRVFISCSFFLMFAIAILFSMRIADGAPFPDSMRLHMRYYNYMFPFFYILLASHANNIKSPPKWAWVIIVPFAIAALSLTLNSLNGYISLPLDAPELRGLSKNTAILPIIGVVTGLALLFYYWKPSTSVYAYIGLILPISTAIGSVNILQDISVRSNDTPGDSAGKTVRGYLGSQTKRVGFFGNVDSVNQAMFYAGGPGSYTYLLDHGDPLPNLDQKILIPKRINALTVPVHPSNTNWIVVFGERAVSADYLRLIRHSDWSLFRKNKGIEAVPAFNLSDANWINGISRNGTAFFVEDSPKAMEMYKPGAMLKFADGQFRNVVSISRSPPYLNVFMNGSPLDGNLVGYPNPIEIFD